MRASFTATRQGMTEAQKDKLQFELQYTHPVLFIHGGCVGGDNEADMIAVALHLYRAIYPSNLQDRLPLLTFLARDEYRLYIHEAAPPLKRNHTIVDRGDILIACPHGKTEVLRSGTWATIRYARKQHKPITIIWPDGSILRE